MDLKELKTRYDSLKGKYKLPSFRELNEAFEVEKIEKDTDYVLRAVRKAMMEKVVNSLSFLEMLINQVNAPGIYLPFMKSMTGEDKQVMEKMYKVLGDLSLASLDLEIDYSEKGEAELIKKALIGWNSIKPDFRKIMIKVKNPVFNGVRKEKSYFG